MSTKQTAYEDLLSVIKEFDLAPSTVGREIANDPGFMARMKDTNKSISTTTLDEQSVAPVGLKNQKTFRAVPLVKLPSTGPCIMRSWRCANAT